jgi:hypothetical protein
VSMPSGCASRRGRLAVPIDRLATTSLQRLRSHTGPWPGGGRLTRLVEQAPATHQEPSVGPLDQLGRLVVSRIQVVDGVTRTLTCMVIRR